MTNENLYTTGCIRTYTGKYVNPTQPKTAEICIEDIAHALSQQPRFGGHLPVFYSVAQHCIAVAQNLPDEHKLAGLLHDASEAYLIDVPRPVKDQLTGYREIEHALMQEIANRFGFIWPMSSEVKDIDESMLRWEWDYIMLGKPSIIALDIYPSEIAEREFINLFNQFS